MTRRLLALDSSSEWCSAALAVGDEVDAVAEQAGARHAERLLPMVEGLLAGRGLAVADIDGVAFGAGPGAFTGLRVACALAQGLGWAVERPLVPVDSLAALAVVAAGGAERTVLVAIDARVQEVYGGVYRVDADGRIDVRRAPFLAAPADGAALLACVLDTLPADEAATVVGAGDAFARYDEAFAPLAERCARVDAAAVARADAVVRIAQARFDSDARPAAEAAPTYVRDKVALDVDEQRALRARRDAA